MNGWVLGVEERDDGGALDLSQGESLSVSELSSPSATVIELALSLVGSIRVIAASGMRLIPSHLTS